MKMGWLRTLILASACLSGCASKKPQGETMAVQDKGKVMVEFSFAGENGKESRYAISVVDPWVLGENELWRCDVSHESFRSIMALKRTGADEFFMGSGIGSGKTLELYYEGVLRIASDLEIVLMMAEPPVRGISVKFISSGAAEEIEKTLAENGGKLTPCARESEVSIPEGGTPPQVEDGE